MNLQAVKQSLRESLPGASDAALHALSAALLNVPDCSGASSPSCSSNSPFDRLLHEGCSPLSIQSALFDYRDTAMHTGQASPEDAKRIIRQIDRLGLLLLQAITRFWQRRVSELDARLADTATELRLASARSRWLREGEVTLYNYFREVPITARVAIHREGDSGFSVDLNNDLVHVLAAGEGGRFAHIRLPDLHSALRLEVESSVGQRVHFTYAGVFKTAEERRQHIRVQCDDLLAVVLRDASGKELQAVLRDISQSGFGLSAGQACSLRVGDRLSFRVRLGGADLKGESSVCWVARSGVSGSAQARFGIELDMALNLMHRLQNEVAQRQKRILAALKMLGVPDGLL